MKTVVTHSGSFHADDVFAVAAFQLLLGTESVEVVRTRDDGVIAKGDYVVDVGGVYDHESKRYDHHQNGAPVRENGIPYAGFGLMWKHYGEEISGSAEVAALIEEKLCLAIDAYDNGMSIWKSGEHDLPPITWDKILKAWSAIDGLDEDNDEQFLTAVAIARTYLERRIKKETQKLVDQAVAEALYESAKDKRIIVSDLPISRRWFIDRETVAVVCPRDRSEESDWMVIAVNKGDEGFETKVQFPETWAGLRVEELNEVTDFTDAIFCHKSRYLFISGSKNSAVKATEFLE